MEVFPTNGKLRNTQLPYFTSVKYTTSIAGSVHSLQKRETGPNFSKWIKIGPNESKELQMSWKNADV